MSNMHSQTFARVAGLEAYVMTPHVFESEAWGTWWQRVAAGAQ